MKKLLSVLLVVVLAFSALVMTGCNGNNTDAKLGLGVVNSTEEGTASLTTNVAAVLVDANGVIKACTVDETNEVAATVSAEGVITVADNFSTKNELGTAYGMSAIGKTEWNEQAAAFAGVCVGKTVDEVKALVVNGYQPNDEVKAAGCTVAISGMAQAVVKAVENATVTGALVTDSVALGVVTKAEATNAENVTFTVTVVAAAKASGKVTAMVTDEVVAEFGVSATGAVTVPESVKTKNELGTAYGMSAIGKTEWNEQAKGFSSVCVGKNADAIAQLVVNGYQPSDEVKAAGCTIAVSSMVKAAVKAAK